MPEFLHFKRENDEIVVRTSQISSLRKEGKDVHIYLIGDCEPFTVNGKVAHHLWEMMKGASLSIKLTA